MSLLGRTLPFALVAAFFPAGLAVMLWLLSLPQGRARGLVYFAGAAACTVGSGVAILTVVGEAGSAPQQHPGAVAAVRIAVGLLLSAFGVYLLCHHSDADGGLPSRVRHASTHPRYGWVFLLGLVMWTPSFAYLAALGFIADADLNWAARWSQLLLIDAVILLMVEVPLMLEAFSPGWANRKLRRPLAFAVRRAKALGVLTAGGGGLYLVITGVRDLW